MGGLDRQSRTRAGRVPVRHPAAADPESPISDAWKRRLLTLQRRRRLPQPLQPDRVLFLGGAQRFSERAAAALRAPGRLHGRAGRRACRAVPRRRPRPPRLSDAARPRIRREGWVAAGFTEALRTPDSTLIFVTPEKALEIRTDQINCMGCLSACQFSNWAQNEARHDRQEGRPAQLLHPEDAAGDPPFRRRRVPADVRRPQRLSLCLRPVLRQRLRADASSELVERLQTGD